MSKKLDSLYDKSNWNTWKPMLEKYFIKQLGNKCNYCGFSTYDGKTSRCSDTYYGEEIRLITHDMRFKCGFELDLNLFMELGSSNIDPELTDWINQP